MRSRLAAIVMVALAGVAFAAVGVFSSTRHDELEAALGPQAAEPAGSGFNERVAMPRGLVGLELALGLKDAEPTDWEGDVMVSAGQVLDVTVLESGARAEARGAHFAVVTRNSTPAKKQQAKKQAQKKQARKKQAARKAAKAAQTEAIVPVTMRVNLVAPADATVTFTTDRGKFSASLAELKRGGRMTFLDGQAAVERVDPAVRLTAAPGEEDFPAVAKAADGSVWLAYTTYTAERAILREAVAPADFDSVLVPTKNGDRLHLRRYDGESWGPPMPVTDGGLDLWRPAVAVDGRGDVVVVWAQQTSGNWDLYRRSYTPAKGDSSGRWSEIARITDDPGADFHAVVATDSRGTVWVAWQAWRDDNYEVLVTSLAEGSQPRSLSSSPANDWGPAITATPTGNVFVAWDTYERGNYDVRLRSTAEGAKAVDVASSNRFEARPSLACDAAGRVWIAYEEGDENWGKDYSNATPERIPVHQGGFPLYLGRTVRVKCLDADGSLKQAAGSLEDALPAGPRRGKSCPRLAVNESGGVWLLFRRHPLPGGGGEVWDSFATHHDGRAWSPARHLAFSSNVIDNRPALVPRDGGLLAIHSTDGRRNTQSRRQDDLYATWLAPGSQGTGPPALAALEAGPAPALKPVHPNEPADKARLRNYRVAAGGRSLQLLRGEFHRHTEFTSHNDQDGLLEDAWRYALDAADLDWMGDGDHMNGFGHEYMWWLIQKQTDLHNHGRRFVAAYTYERSAVYPNGHRNVMMPRRGIRPLPFGVLEGTEAEGAPDTKNLYACLKHFGGICSSHTSATNMGTDWRDNDPEVEPVVEIYQGHRHNYEHLGAPRSPTEQTQIGGYQPKGYVWNALKKGFRLGFQSSSDHVSTHWSYGIVLAESNTRQALIDAFKERHSYAATDNILLDVRSGDHLMGDVFTTNRAPTISIKVVGTGPIAKVHVIRDDTYALSTQPGADSASLTYTDDDARPGETHYYYVRVEQADTNLAWASPMWITFEK
ncbi:MAG: hypothetical protein ACLQVF_47560 [Isosphaeraceae bacterium]